MPHRLQPQEKEELRWSLSELTGDISEAAEDGEEDEGYHVDDLRGRDEKSTSITTKSYHGPSASHMKRLQMQRKIDSARIAVVHEALDKGIELKDNDLYYQMLEAYPSY